MKKAQRKPGRKAATPARRAAAPAATTPTAAGPAQPVRSRRSLLRLARNGAIGMAVLGGGGWLAVRRVQSHYALRDLSVIGNGTATVVQIHHPTCPICTRLQKEMLEAAKAFDEASLQVRVAGIDTSEGRTLAAQHGVSHATLLLFDGQGRVRQVLAGPNDSATLENAFRAHLMRTRRTTPAS
jgi:hypothetical protein